MPTDEETLVTRHRRVTNIAPYGAAGWQWDVEQDRIPASHGDVAHFRTDETGRGLYWQNGAGYSLGPASFAIVATAPGQARQQIVAYFANPPAS